MKTATVDFAKRKGTVRPLHGVNNGPKTYAFHLDMTPYFQEAGIPYSRLHDTEYPYGSAHFVDIPCIFPNFDADPKDPASYDFTLTDAYLKAIADAGAKIIYRLGVSIEHAPKKYHIFPPKDCTHWAEICAGIVRHYNEGWADGMRLDIEYWEIWNEPENPPMWQGTPDQYYQLYQITANRLKREFPALKVGGYAGCGFYAILQEKPDAFQKSFLDFMDGFLAYIADPAHPAPLDFFSWHVYSNGDLTAIRRYAEYARDTLNRYGFAATESILDEWNYTAADHTFERMKSMEAAAFLASALCMLQKETDVTIGAYYDAQPAMIYCGLFSQTGPLKPFYAFKAYNALFRLGTETESQSQDEVIKILAALNGDDAAILLSNFQGAEERILLKIAGFAGAKGVEAQFYLLDSAHDLACVRKEIFFSDAQELAIELKHESVVLIQLRKRSGTD